LILSATTSLLPAYTTAAGVISSGTTYQFWVTATNYGGEGANSPKTSVTAASVPDQPLAPVVTATYNSILLNWTAPNNRG